LRPQSKAHAPEGSTSLLRLNACQCSLSIQHYAEEKSRCAHYGKVQRRLIVVRLQHQLTTHLVDDRSFQILGQRLWRFLGGHHKTRGVGALEIRGLIAEVQNGTSPSRHELERLGITQTPVTSHR